MKAAQLPQRVDSNQHHCLVRRGSELNAVIPAARCNSPSSAAQVTPLRVDKTLLQHYSGARTAMFGALTPSLPSFAGSASVLLGSGTASTPPRQTARRSTSGPPSIGPGSIPRATVSLEYASLRYQSHCPLGMYIIPFADDPFIWDGALFIHQGESGRIHPYPSRS